MFSTNKIDIDRHVEESLRKINNETERNLRCLSFAKQYFKIERYEEARRYVATYLSVKPNSADAHCLLGKCLEKLGRKQAAVQAFTTSLRLNSKQNNVVIKVCELLASDDVELDQDGAKYFFEKAQTLEPHNPAVFNLKQRILVSQSDDPREVTNLILKELESRPSDVRLRVRLLKHLVQHQMIKEAYKHAAEIESKDLPVFHTSIDWYEAVGEVLVKYQRIVSLPNSLGWEFWFFSISVLDKIVSLTLDEHQENVKPTSEYVTALFNFDQSFAKASQNLSDCPDKNLVQEFLNHYSGQLCLHLAILIYKQAQKDLMKYKEAVNITLPLLFASYHTQLADLQSLWYDHAPESRKNLVKKWRREGAYRCSQAGHILQASAKDRKSIIIGKANQFSTGMWREQLFKKVFITRDQQLKMKTSYFLTDPKLLEVTIQLPETVDLLKYDEEAQLNYPDSLHHHIWLAMNNKLANIKCTAFEGLQYSIKNLKNCGAETLNVLDIQAFIYCATLCAKYNIENNRLVSYCNVDKPNVIPAAVTPELSTYNQNTFFKAAFKMYKNEYDPAVEQLRLILVEGIKIVRCVDHGLDIKLLVSLAQTFAERAKTCTKQSEIEFNEIRAEMYWKAALPILEKMRNNQAVSYPPNKLFTYKSKDLPLLEINDYIESGKLFSGVQLMKKKEYEKSLKILETLKDPYASFYQAQIYKHMADQQTNQNKENVTSEMRSRNIILLSRARDCLYLTLDRLREPSVDQRHPLNEQLGTEIEKMERLLSRIDPDCNNRNECDGMSDENVSSVGSTGDHYITSYSLHTSGYHNSAFIPRIENHNHSTPHRSELFRREAKPSPERLDAQLRQLAVSKDAAINHILEQNKIMVDSHRALAEELKGFKEAVNNLTSTVDELKNLKYSQEDIKEIKKSVNELKSSIDDLDGFRNVFDMVYEMKKEITELKKDLNRTTQLNEDDGYGLANEFTSECNLNSNFAAYNTSLYTNYTNRLPGPSSLYGPTPLYPGVYPPMPFACPGLVVPQAASGFQFSGADQQFPGQDFRTNSALPQVQPTYNQALAQTTMPLSSLLTGTNLTQNNSTLQQAKVSLGQSVYTPTTSKAPPPVNVVITVSDPLPSIQTTTSQPKILSVTIPPQHLKDNISKSQQPHNYQIPLPSTSISHSSPSVLSKPPPAVSTQSILSNVAPPVYSAITSKSDNSLNVSLGLEKTEQSFSESMINKSNISSSSIEEHDPCPDFKPIIPLPAEVPVTTGEESEVVLFSNHAKLFRYVSESKEWRERGVGILKILKNPQTNKIRILMRRDQVLKICANHFLTNDMNLTAMPKNDKAYIWAAQDYADEDLVVEKLCVKFKTTEEANKFFDAFENAKKDLSKMRKEDPISDAKASIGGFQFSGTPNFKPKTDVSSTIKLPTDTTKTSPFAGFTFGGVKSSSFPTFQTNFVPVEKANENVITSSKHQKDDKEDDEFIPTAEFKPVVPLPELVDVKTGEEGAEVLFENKAKLLRFDGEKKEWKEKGVGVIKLLKDSIIRLVMRRDQVLKVCCNHQVLKTMQFKIMPNNPKAITWCAKDFSEGVFKPETLAIRFKNEEIAQSFLTALTNAQTSMDETSCVQQEIIAIEPFPKQGFGDKFKSAKGSWECKNCLVVNDGKANYCLACETPKNDTVPPTKKDDSSGAAFSFGVNISSGWGNAFKQKEGSWECKACYIRNDPDKVICVSCETPKDGTVPKKDEVGSKFTFGLPPVTSKFIPAGFGDMFKPKEGSWECKQCMVRNNADVLYCAACSAPKDNTVPTKDTKVPIEGTQKFTFGFSSPQTTTQPKFIFGQSIETSSPSSLNFTCRMFTSKDAPKEKFVFGSPQKHDFEFTPRSPRRISSGTKDDESDASFVEEECDNIYFKPVIPLPDKVEVKTGEEDEEVLYCRRAKLYRFVDAEWKERGLGDIKILKRKDTGKLRVLMRREQVLKICLNHVLTKDIKYLPKDEKTWLFNAPDFTDGEIINEQFCVRFKNAEIAQEFLKAVNDAIGGASGDTGKPEVTTDDEDVEFVSETKVTPEEEKEAIQLGLPAKFFSYRQLPDCKCDQCKKDDEYLKSWLNEPIKSTVKLGNESNNFASINTSTSSSVFGTPKSETFSFKSTTDSTTSTSTLKVLLEKPSLFSSSPVISSPSVTNVFSVSKSESGGFNFGTKPFESSPFVSKTTNIFDTPTTITESKSTGSFFTPSASLSTNTSIFGGSNPTFASPAEQKTTNSFANMRSIFGGGDAKLTDSSVTHTFGSTLKIEGKTTKLKDEDDAVLDCKSGVSFAALAAKVNEDTLPAFVKKDDVTKTPFAFLGAGTPVFGMRGTNKSDVKSPSKEQDDGDEEYDPHYDPIVPLPDAIVVTTGEEDEKVLFAERAKLFRYDTEVKQWKERGVGQMKILYHPANNTYRFLLRREQVHKVVLNQLIVSDLDLQPMKTNVSAWVWAGYNYVEDETNLEKLAIKFKTQDLAKIFYKTVQDVLEKMKNNKTVKVESATSEPLVIPSSIQNYGVEDISGDDEQGGAKSTSYDDEDDDDEEEDEDDEDDDESDRTVMFVKACTLSEEVNQNWQLITSGDLEVYYDPDLYAARISITDENGQVVSNTLIGVNTEMKLHENSCVWRAVEWASGNLRFRTLRVTFKTCEAAKEFHSIYLEGLHYAQEFDVVDELPVAAEEEAIDP